MSINPKGFGVTLTDATDTVIYTVPPNTTATITELVVMVTLPGTSAEITLKIGGRNKVLAKMYADNANTTNRRTILMPGETLMAWSNLAAAVDLNISLIERSV